MNHKEVSINNWKNLLCKSSLKTNIVNENKSNKSNKSEDKKRINTINIGDSYLRGKESDIFYYLIIGKTRKQIEEILTIKKRSIEKYIENSLSRFGYERCIPFLDFLINNHFKYKYEEFKNGLQTTSKTNSSGDV